MTSLRPVSYLVPLELDCHHDDDELRQCLRDKQRNEKEDNAADAVTLDVGPISEAEDQGGPVVSVDAQGGILPPDVSSSGSTFYHRTSGSSRASGLATGTTTGCNFRNNVATPSTISPSLPPHTVLTQPLEGEERDAGWGEASTSQRQPRRAALRQRELLGRLLRDDLL